MSIEKKVEEILREHLGKENQIKAREIADMIESTENDRTVYSKTRKIITGLIEEGYPIGSSNKGYFWLETKEELEEYKNNLKNREEKIEKRREKVIENFEKEQDGK